MEGNLRSGGKDPSPDPSPTLTALCHSSKPSGLHYVIWVRLCMPALCDGVTVSLGPEMNTLHLSYTVTMSLLIIVRIHLPTTCLMS